MVSVSVKAILKSIVHKAAVWEKLALAVLQNIPQNEWD